MSCVVPVLLVALGLPPAAPWVGELVMPREEGLGIEQVVDGAPTRVAALDANAVYRVLSELGGRLVLREDGREGTIDKAQVVLLADAPAHFTALIRRNPTDPKLYARRATARQTRGRRDTYIVVGEARRGDLDDALADLDEAVRLDPGAALWWNERAWLRLRRRDWDGARDDAAEAIRREPKAAGGYHRRALAWQGKGEYDAALKDLDEAIRRTPTEAVFWNARGNLWTDGKKDHARAVQDYDEAIRLDPKEPIYLSNRGAALTDLGESDAALADLAAAARLDPNWATPHRRRGNALRQQKEWAEAAAAFARAVELDPDGAATNSLAWLLATCPADAVRDGRRAVELAALAVRLDGQAWYSRDTLAAAHAEAGAFDKAVAAQGEAIELLKAGKDAGAKSLAGCEKRLKLYRDKKPYRDTGDD